MKNVNRRCFEIIDISISRKMPASEQTSAKHDGDRVTLNINHNEVELTRTRRMVRTITSFGKCQKPLKLTHVDIVCQNETRQLSDMIFATLY
jgi:hypothetical protein